MREAGAGGLRRWSATQAPRADLRGLAVILVTWAAAGCTTSRALQRYYDAEAALAGGRAAQAVTAYEEAWGRDRSLVGAELNRLALVARNPTSLRQVQDAYDKLAAREPGRAEVALFGAGLDLLAGQHARAWQRLEALGDPASLPRDAAQQRCPSLAAAAWGLRLEAAVALDRHRDAVTAAERWQEQCGPAALAVRAKTLWATAALRLGELEAARQPLAAIEDAAEPGAARLRAAWALRQGDPAAALRILASLADAEAELLRASAHLQRGATADASAALGRARATGAHDDDLVALEGALALATGDLERCRDLLAGLVARGGARLRWTTSWHLGQCELRRGGIVEAERAFVAAARLCPTCPEPRDALAALGAAGLR